MPGDTCVAWAVCLYFSSASVTGYGGDMATGEASGKNKLQRGQEGCEVMSGTASLLGRTARMEIVG